MKKIRTIKGKENGKRVAIVGCVHGDEKYSLRVFKSLKSLSLLQGEVDFFIGNFEAFKVNKRYVDEDLNRSFNKELNSYESQLSKKIIEELSSYDYIIDLHSTTAKTNPFMIITNIENKNFAKKIRINKVVFIEDEKKTALISNFKNAFSLEISDKSYKSSIKNSRKYIVNFLKNEGFIENKTVSKEFKYNNIYKVIEKSENCLNKNFKRINREGKTRYQILNGEKSYENQRGFETIKVYK